MWQKQVQKELCASVLLIHLFFVCLYLYIKPVLGGDILEYYTRFNSIGDYYPLEPLFELYTTTAHLISDDGLFYVRLLTYTGIFFQFIVIYAISGNRLLAYISMFSTSFPLLTWSGVYRNGISIPLILVSFYLLFNRKILFSMIALFIAMLFHSSSIIFIPIWIALVLNIFTRKTLYYTSVFCLVSLLVGYFGEFFYIKILIREVIIEIIQPIIPYEYSRPLRYFISDVVDFNGENSTYLMQTSKVLLEIIVQYFLFFVLFIFDKSNCQRSFFWAKIYIMSVLVYVFSIGNVFSYRFYLASAFIFTIYLSYRTLYLLSRPRLYIGLVILIMYILFSFYSFPPEKVGLMYLNPLS
ncbi:EpsG family protein [Aeromonas sp. QDB41]|uniref:EpsG family protein n=1 Tax=unclassified Aeromonas TaxID=257493 RepID=UPI003FA4C3B0